MNSEPTFQNVCSANEKETEEGLQFGLHLEREVANLARSPEIWETVNGERREEQFRGLPRL